MTFAGIKDKTTFDLEGNFHRDIRGAEVHFTGHAYEDNADIDSGDYFEGFAQHQTGKAGDITAGLPPFDYGRAPNGTAVAKPLPVLDLHLSELLS